MVHCTIVLSKTLNVINIITFITSTGYFYIDNITARPNYCFLAILFVYRFILRVKSIHYYYNSQLLFQVFVHFFCYVCQVF